jgi:2-polyprenyl-3-methyl-5-hydroxy-6-metoxy-1,4-benzoquinol methylase
MSRIGRFDTDSEALRARITAHERAGSADFDGWVASQLDVHTGQRVLDLGAGTGKQSVPAAHAVGPEGHVVAVDASAESLAALADRAREEGVDGRVDTEQTTFDALRVTGPFDRVVSCYALYYAEDPKAVLERIHAVLAPGAVVFVCGPSRHNNEELRELHRTLGGAAAAAMTPAARFMEELAPATMAKLFAACERVEFENPLEFGSRDELLTYWRNYNLYDPALDSAFERSAPDRFRTVKRAIGLRATR